MEIDTTHDGDLIVDGDDLVVRGMVNGNIRVTRGIANIRGMVNGNIVVEPQGEAVIHGTVDGYARNAGGRLRVFGMVHGGVRDESGTTEIDPKAVIESR